MQRLLTAAASYDHLNVHSCILLNDLQRQISEFLTDLKSPEPAGTVAAKSKLKSIKNLSDGFGSHRVHEADGRPVQDDGVDRAERFKKEGLLIF